MNIFIITEGDKEVGFGHITRCLSIYQAFLFWGTEPCLIINGDETVVELLKNTNSIIFDWLKDTGRLYDIVENSDIIIIDSYKAGLEVYKKISEFSKLNVYIDDNNRLNYPQGILVNGTLNAIALYDSFDKNHIYFLGTDYIPLRKNFWNKRKKINKIERNKIKNCMITFGGDDFRNLTPKIIRKLEKTYPKIHKKVVIGKAFKNIDEIKSINYTNMELYYNLNADEMINLMLESDIAVSAAGQTLYELALVGVPTIGIVVADNQFNNANNWQKEGFILFAGFWDDKELLNNVSDYVHKLEDNKIRQTMSEIGRKHVDGHGALRIATNCLKTYFSGQKIILRKAKINDLWKVFKLSNDHEVRENSFNNKPINKIDHQRWFFNKINNGNYLFLVAEIGNNFAGQVRFELDDKEAIISLSVVKTCRGLGIGKKMLKKSLNFLKSEENYHINRVYALVKEENENSVNLFESCGFRLVNKCVIENQKALKFCHDIN